jgi:sporulation protein YlmC with PRC-barrel domain
MNPATLSASTISGDPVVNRQGEDLGKIEDLVLDIDSGRVAYAVLSFGGFLGMGDKLFALPWQSLELDADNHRFILDVAKERLENAPGFDKDHWPNMADRKWGATVHQYYGHQPYWSA